VLLEVFTDPKDESDALKILRTIKEVSKTSQAKQITKSILGDSGVKFAKKVLGK
jgi:hypothetical protein